MNTPFDALETTVARDAQEQAARLVQDAFVQIFRHTLESAQQERAASGRDAVGDQVGVGETRGGDSLITDHLGAAPLGEHDRALLRDELRELPWRVDPALGERRAAPRPAGATLDEAGRSEREPACRRHDGPPCVGTASQGRDDGAWSCTFQNVKKPWKGPIQFSKTKLADVQLRTKIPTALTF